MSRNFSWQRSSRHAILVNRPSPNRLPRKRWWEVSGQPAFVGAVLALAANSESVMKRDSQSDRLGRSPIHLLHRAGQCAGDIFHAEMKDGELTAAAKGRKDLEARLSGQPLAPEALETQGCRAPLAVSPCGAGLSFRIAFYRWSS